MRNKSYVNDVVSTPNAKLKWKFAGHTCQQKTIDGIIELFTRYLVNTKTRRIPKSRCTDNSKKHNREQWIQIGNKRGKSGAKGNRISELECLRLIRYIQNFFPKSLQGSVFNFVVNLSVEYITK